LDSKGWSAGHHERLGTGQLARNIAAGVAAALATAAFGSRAARAPSAARAKVESVTLLDPGFTARLWCTLHHGDARGTWHYLAAPERQLPDLSDPFRCPREDHMTMRTWLRATVFTACHVVALGCSDGPSAPPPAPVPTAITLSRNTASLTYLGQALQVNATVKDQNGAAMNTAVGWSVDDADIATVSATGMITAVRNGSTTVRATAGNATASVTVNVTQQAAAISLSTNTGSFTHLGQTLQVNATVSDQSGAAVNTTVGWSVDNAAVATVSAAGVITAVRNGSTTVRATAGNVSATVTVEVSQQPAALAVSTTTVSLTGFGATFAVGATVRDAGGHAIPDAVVTWTSLNDAVAAVSSSGIIVSAGLGVTEVTAVVGTLTARIAVSVGAATIQINTPAGMQDMIRGVDVRFVLTAQTAGVRWSSSNPAVATIDAVTGAVHTVAEGVVTFTATIAGGGGSWTRNVVRIRRMQVDPYLATPLAGALWEVPVILIEYHPTADAANLDVGRAPDYWSLGPMSLDSLERLTMRYARRRKMMVEQGSRFRGYNDAAAQPSLGYRVVEHVVVYDQIPPNSNKRSGIPGNPRFENWHEAFTDLQLVPIIRARKVREVWAAWSSFDGNYPSYNPAIHKVDDMRAGWESNMASPTTGDVSNSDRDPNDAPLVEHTYIIYGINFRRTQAEAVHNVGHQVEAMFAHVNGRQDGNSRLFWRDFVGQDASGRFITGRAGWTHMPPNTTTDYDYLNGTLVASDIEQWRPDNTGTKKQVNVNTWANLTYPWPGEADFAQRAESQWYVYWFQSLPGRGNRIPHGANWMTNWWAFVADWDAAITSSLGLYGASPAAQSGSGAPYAFAAPSMRASPIRHSPQR
jgi:uncharacterized protein YjdB